MNATATADEPQRPDLAVLLADETIWTADDWRRVISFAQSGGRPDAYRQQPRTWVGEAKAAFDQSVTEAEPFPGADFWVARAQAAAAIASAEQARAANLIAWKQLQATRSATSDGGVDLLPLAGDEITQEIEYLLGIEP